MVKAATILQLSSWQRTTSKRQYDQAFAQDYTRGRGRTYCGRGRGTRGGRGNRGGKPAYAFPPPTATLSRPEAPQRS